MAGDAMSTERHATGRIEARPARIDARSVARAVAVWSGPRGVCRGGHSAGRNSDARIIKPKLTATESGLTI